MGNIKWRLGRSVAVSVVAVAGLFNAAQAADKKPNILIIWGDDVGQSNISAYSHGVMGYKTPNIDRVAKEGVMFTDYYAEQSCTAGRASFITGQSGLRTGMTKVGLPGATEGLRKEDPTIAELLKPLGYATAQIGKNPFFCPDEAAAGRWETLLDDARKAGSSLGAVVECVARGVPAGWGAPLYAKLDAELAAAMMSITSSKGVEIGAGFEAARLRGEENADRMRPGSNVPEFLANNSGGVAGGISTGQPVVVRVAFKPTSSILTPVETITRTGEATEIVTKGRHDPCVVIRGAPRV